MTDYLNSIMSSQFLKALRENTTWNKLRGTMILVGFVGTTGHLARYLLRSEYESHPVTLNVLEIFSAHEGSAKFIGDPVKHRKVEVGEMEKNFRDAATGFRLMTVPVYGNKGAGELIAYFVENINLARIELALSHTSDIPKEVFENKRLLIYQNEKYIRKKNYNTSSTDSLTNEEETDKSTISSAALINEKSDKSSIAQNNHDPKTIVQRNDEPEDKKDS